MKIRVVKVLKEFNITIDTLADFLKKKGVEIDTDNPNAPLPEGAYELAEKEFAKDRLIKKQSREVISNVRSAGAKEREPHADETPEKEILIKTNVLTDREAAPKSEAVKPAHSEPAETKVSASESKPAEEAKPVSAPAAQPAAEPVEAPKAAEPKIEETPASDKPEIKVLGKIDLDKPVSKAPEKTDQPKPKAAETSARPVAPKEQPNVKVDAASAAQPAAKPVAEPATKKEEKPEIPQRPVIEHIETKVEKLTGPVVSGHVDLSQFEKKPSSHADRNKKRERIHKVPGKVDINAAAHGGQQGGGKNRQHDRQDPHQNNGKGKGKDKNAGKKFAQVEIEEDEIQRQIRETYARMTENKGKTKGSKHRREKRELFEQKLHEEQEMEMLSSNILKATEFVTVNELAIMMNNTPVTKVIEACMNLGLMVSINQRLDAEALVLVAEEFGYKIEFTTADDQNAIAQDEDRPEDMVSRPPIITVMGHVDHGKTSLLDYIRKSNVIAGEAGGITQHIGAYNVKLPDGRRITFLDTPGHEAFTAMRARGAKLTDIAIIIVAADDAVMPQTIEAINHAQAAGVPMVFAINKIDKPGANGERIKEQLSAMNILVEDWGGNYQCQEISAKKGINVDKLLDKVLLEADMLELKANPDKRAVGSVVESSLDKGRGYLATVLVQSGTLRVGDAMLSGCYSGKVKAMFNERGQKIKEAGPSTPVLVLGLNGAPTAGDTFNVLEDEREAKEIANKREQLLRMQGIKTQQHITLEEIGRRIAIGNFKELNIIIKADVDGSIEALGDSLIKLSTEEVKVNVIHKAVGAISESDILLAEASNAIIIGFQVRPSAEARRQAEKAGIEIRLYSVIYDAINEVKDGIEGMLAPEEKEEVTATAEVRETFKISKVGTVAGCMVKEGKLNRNAKIRVIRDGIVVYTGLLGSLKRFKDDVKEVAAGYDCGLNIENFNDIKVGDVVEAYTIVEIKRKL